MTVFSAKEVEKALKRVGFKMETGDHNYFRLYIDGKRTSIRTKTSHNKQDIGDALIEKMRKQVHLTKKQFIDLINNNMTVEQYIAILKENQLI